MKIKILVVVTIICAIIGGIILLAGQALDFIDSVRQSKPKEMGKNAVQDEKKELDAAKQDVTKDIEGDNIQLNEDQPLLSKDKK